MERLKSACDKHKERVPSTVFYSVKLKVSTFGLLRLESLEDGSKSKSVPMRPRVKMPTFRAEINSLEQKMILVSLISLFMTTV